MREGARGLIVRDFLIGRSDVSGEAGGNPIAVAIRERETDLRQRFARVDLLVDRAQEVLQKTLLAGEDLRSAGCAVTGRVMIFLLRAQRAWRRPSRLW